MQNYGEVCWPCGVVCGTGDDWYFRMVVVRRSIECTWLGLVSYDVIVVDCEVGQHPLNSIILLWPLDLRRSLEF